MTGSDGVQGEGRQLRLLSGESAYETAIAEVIGRAERELHVFDADLSRGGFHTQQRCDALQSFLARRRGNQLVVILHGTEVLAGRMPRFLALLKTHGHAISIRQTEDRARSVADPLVIADALHYVHRFHRDGPRFLQGMSDPDGARQLEERFRQLFEASFPAVSATTLGL